MKRSGKQLDKIGPGRAGERGTRTRTQAWRAHAWTHAHTRAFLGSSPACGPARCWAAPMLCTGGRRAQGRSVPPLGHGTPPMPSAPFFCMPCNLPLPGCQWSCPVGPAESWRLGFQDLLEASQTLTTWQMGVRAPWRVVGCGARRLRCPCVVLLLLSQLIPRAWAEPGRGGGLLLAPLASASSEAAICQQGCARPGSLGDPVNSTWVSVLSLVGTPVRADPWPWESCPLSPSQALQGWRPLVPLQDCRGGWARRPRPHMAAGS